MLDNLVARASIARLTDPVGRALVRRGVSPDLVTAIGTVGSMAASVWFLPRGQLFVGGCVITAFVLCDLVDGAMARALGSGTRFGAVLDSTCDRLADGALFAALTWWLLRGGDDPLTAAAALISLLAGQAVSYVKARAEASGLIARGGLVERAERLILALVGMGLAGLGVPWILPVALWLLSAGSLITLGQRLVAVYRSAHAAGPAADLPPTPAPGAPRDLSPGLSTGLDGTDPASPDDGTVSR